MISNATALIHLSRINKLDILKKVYSVITIPPEVKEEILIEDKEGYIALKKAVGNWIIVEEPQRILDLGLGRGEEAAISLALTKSDKIILDDAKARKAARTMGIGLDRTTTAVFKAVKKEILDEKEALAVINKLIEDGYYIAPKFYTELVKKLT